MNVRRLQLLLMLAGSAALVDIQAANSASPQMKPVLKAIDPASAQTDPGSTPPPAPPAAGPGNINGAPIQPNFIYQPYQPSQNIPTYPVAPYAQPLQYAAPPPYQQPPTMPQQMQQQPYGQAPNINPNLIPEFGKQLPTAPISQTPMNPQAPSWSGGYAPAPHAAVRSMDEQRVAAMEQMAFGSPYPEHEVEDRVEHLEREVFGKAFENDNIQARIARLEAKMGGQGAFGKAAATVAQNPPPLSQPPAPTQGPMYAPPNVVPINTAPPQYYSQPQAPQQPAYPPQRPPLSYMPPQQIPPYNQFGQGPGQPTGPAPAVNPWYYQSPAGSYPTQPNQPAMQATPPMTRPAPAVKPPVSETAPAAHTSAGIAGKLPFDKKAGDYFNQIQRFDGACARWTSFPIKVHLPQNCPAAWTTALEAAVKKWNQYIPLEVTQASEPADIEIAFINHLQPSQLGITNLEIFNGRMRVTIYLLRPTYYVKTTPEKTIGNVIMHELGHGVGLFGHSYQPGDVMQLTDFSGKGKPPQITARDINTLKRVYESPSLPSGFQSGQPISWASKSK